MDRGAILSLPNVLSLSRLGLAALFVAEASVPWRVFTVALASLTDVLDGWIARRRGKTSRFGALLDPVTDRFFVFVAVCTFLFEGTLATWEYFVVISRDLMTAIGFLVARAMPSLRPVTFKARPGGKIVTSLQLLVLGAVLLRPDWVTPLVAVLGLASLAAVVDYTLMLHRERQKVLAGVRTKRGAAILLAVGLAAGGTAIEAQEGGEPRLRPGVRAQWRDPATVEGGPELSIVASRTIRVDVAALAGARRVGGEPRTVGRFELLGRFLLDPYFERPVGLHGGAGVALQCVERAPCRPVVVARVGVEGRPWGPLVPALEGGIGGGAQVGVVVRVRGRRFR